MFLVQRWISLGQKFAVAMIVLAVAGCNSDPTLATDCAAAMHLCDSVCVDNAAVEHCGAACTSCPGTANGDPVCEDGTCGLKCHDGALLCNGACAPCPSATGVQAFACQGGACVASCAPDSAPCAGGCCAVDTGLVLTNSGAVSPSIAVDSKQNPHVSFLKDHYTLMYAHRDSGAWQVVSIDAKDGNANYSTSIAVAAGDLPMVAYSSNYSVRLARFTGSAWQHETAYQNSVGYGPALSARALALDSAGRPHIVTSQVQCGVPMSCNSDLVHIWWNGTAWKNEGIQSANGNNYSVPSLAIDGKDVLHVSWVGYYDSALNYATNAGGKWTSGAALNKGTCCDTSYIALTPAGAPVIAFKAQGGSYAVASRPMAAWGFDSRHADVSVVGNLTFNPAGQLHYLLSNSAGQLLHGSPSASTWTETVISTEAKQFLMALDASERTHVIMATPTALRYVRLNKE